MQTRLRCDNPVITGWSAVSPFGVGRDAFAAGVRAGRPTATDIDPERWQVPDHQACLVPDFDIRAVLGRKGTRTMDRVSALAVTTVGRLLGAGEGDRLFEPDGDTALVLGTTTGSVQSMMDFTRSSLTAEKPFFVDPAVMPNAVMNCAAGLSAIWYQLKGPNTTVAGGRVAGIFALNYARRLLASGRATKVLCGAAEEYSEERSWLEHAVAGSGRPPVTLGEGSAMLLLEAADAVAGERPPIAELLACEFRIWLTGTEPATVLADCVRAALSRARTDAGDVWAASTSGGAGPLGDAERAVAGELFDPRAIARAYEPALTGETGAASAALQLAALLVLGEQPDAAGRVAVVTSVDRDGAVACAVLRLLGPAAG